MQQLRDTREFIQISQADLPRLSALIDRPISQHLAAQPYWISGIAEDTPKLRPSILWHGNVVSLRRSTARRQLLEPHDRPIDIAWSALGATNTSHTCDSVPHDSGLLCALLVTVDVEKRHGTDGETIEITVRRHMHGQHWVSNAIASVPRRSQRRRTRPLRWYMRPSAQM